MSVLVAAFNPSTDAKADRDYSTDLKHRTGSNKETWALFQVSTVARQPLVSMWCLTCSTQRFIKSLTTHCSDDMQANCTIDRYISHLTTSLALSNLFTPSSF